MNDSEVVPSSSCAGKDISAPRQAPMPCFPCCRLVAQHGPQKWTMIAEHLPGRIGKQCRER